MEIENQIAAVNIELVVQAQKQAEINELYEKQHFEKGLVAAQDALSVSFSATL